MYFQVFTRKTTIKKREFACCIIRFTDDVSKVQNGENASGEFLIGSIFGKGDI